MHLHTYRDESRSRHLDLIGGRGHPWSLDLVVVIASGILLSVSPCTLETLLIRYPTAPPRPPRHRASRGGRPRKKSRPCMHAGQGAFDHENRKTPISKPAANAHRPNVQAETTRMKLRRSCGISWDRSVIAAAPLRWPPARYGRIGNPCQGRHPPPHRCPKEGNR